MLVQRRRDALRLITQHDHALAAGRMARAWRDPAGESLLDLELILAVSLHDAPWREADRRPRLNPATGRPHDFTTYPREEKYAFLARGIDDLGGLHPRVGILVSLHHESFLGENMLPAWREREAVRRKRLSRRLPGGSPDPDADLALLQLFDNLSLFLCLTAPGSDPEAVPGWLRAERLYTVPGPGPDGGGWVMAREWRGPEALALRPFPFAGRAVELEILYRDLPLGPFEDPEEMERAWAGARVEVWRPRLEPA